MDDQVKYLQQLSATSQAAGQAADKIQSQMTDEFRDSEMKAHNIDAVRQVTAPVGMEMVKSGVGDIAQATGMGQAFDDLATGGLQKLASGAVSRAVNQAVSSATDAASSTIKAGLSAAVGLPTSQPEDDPFSQPKPLPNYFDKTGGGAVESDLGTLTAESTALDELPIGPVITAGLGLATVLGAVFGHQEKPRHPPEAQPALNPSTQFGV